MKINTKFDIGQKINIIDLGLSGRITGFYLGETNKLQYNVRYFTKDNGEYKTCYFYEEELNETIIEKKVGFV